MIYKWKIPIVKSSAQAAGEMCEALSKSTLGLTPKSLLDANRPESAPLHNEFEWNNNVAAELWREEQASKIIRLLVVEPEPEKEPVRAFINVISEERTYMPLNVIVNTPDLHMQMLENAMTELRAFQSKYENLKELQPIFDAIAIAEIT